MARAISTAAAPAWPQGVDLVHEPACCRGVDLVARVERSAPAGEIVGGEAGHAGKLSAGADARPTSRARCNAGPCRTRPLHPSTPRSAASASTARCPCAPASFVRLAPRAAAQSRNAVGKASSTPRASAAPRAPRWRPLRRGQTACGSEALGAAGWPDSSAVARAGAARNRRTVSRDGSAFASCIPTPCVDSMGRPPFSTPPGGGGVTPS